MKTTKLGAHGSVTPTPVHDDTASSHVGHAAEATPPAPTSQPAGDGFSTTGAHVAHGAEPAMPMPAVPSGGRSAVAVQVSQAKLRDLPIATAPRTIELQDGDTIEFPLGRASTSIGGVKINGFSYFGSIPGPTIKVKQGAEINVVLKNNTDQPTTLHPHGLRLDNAFDGIPGVTQDPIKPGDEFSYKLKFPDAGLHWYHPHIRDWFVRELGAYGTFLVEPNDATTTAR